MSPSRDTRSATDDGPPNYIPIDSFASGRRQETPWGYTGRMEDSTPNNAFVRRRETFNCDDPPSYSSLTIRRSDDPEHPWNRAPSTYRPFGSASSTAGSSHRQPIRQQREHELRKAVQSSPESRLGSFPPFLSSLPSQPLQGPLVPEPSRSPRASLPASTTKPPGAVSTPLWRLGYTHSNTINPSAKVIAPMNKETGEVHGSSFAEPTYANVDFNTPSPVSKDISRTMLPSRSLGDRYKPPVFGEPTALRSTVFKPTAYQPNVFTTPEFAPEARREVVTKARDSIFLNKSTRLEDLPALRARLATIRDLRELNYSDAEIETMVSNMDGVGLSFPELLEKLRNGPLSDIATKKAERAQSNVGVRPTTSTTPTTPVKRNVPTYSLNPSDVEGRRTQLPVRSRTTTKTVKSRFSVENLASVQTDFTTRAELDRVLAMDKSKVPKEKVPEEEFETLNLDSDEEEWDKIDVEDEWEVVNDPRAEMEKNVV